MMYESSLTDEQRTVLRAVGRDNASCGLDQGCVEDYRVNLYDTLVEMGYGNNADAVECAENAFENEIAKRKT